MIPTLFRVLALSFLLSLAALPARHAGAQEVVPASSQMVSDQRAVIAALAKRADDIERRLPEVADDDARLVELRTQLEEIERELLKASVVFRPRLADINARIEQLGSPPGEGQPPETELVAAERLALVAEKGEMNATLGIAEDLSIRAAGLVTRIADMRRDLFSRLLTKRYDIGISTLSTFGEAAQSEGQRFYRTVSSWVSFVAKYKLSSVLGAAFFALLAAAILLIGGRRLFGEVFRADPEAVDPSSISKLSVAFWSTLLPTTAFGVFLAATFFFFNSFGVLRGDIGVMLRALFTVLGLLFFVHRLGVAILAPQLPEWRLIPVRSGAASTLLWLMSATALVSGVDSFLTAVFESLQSPIELTVAEALIATVIIGLLVIAAALVKPFSDTEGAPMPWPRLVRVFLFLLGTVTVVAAVSGYIGLARFISQQIVWTGAVLATMYVGYLSAQAVSEEGAFARTAFGARVQRRLRLEDSALDQFSLAIGIAINIAVVLAGLPLILLQWGFQPGDLSAWAYRIATGIKVGNFTFSLTGILWGLVVFGVAYVLTRWFQGWLDGSVMARGKVDVGVRNSIRTVVGYAGLALGVLLAVSAAGIDLSSFALIAGGLSLGIGFGLQNVVSNFVSGLILLAERPFKAGDWIVAGNVTGTVKKISVRATEIETFQRQTVILPNSELINSAVGNWTHRNKLGRAEVRVGVAYGSDIRRVHALLGEIVRSHPLVLKNPEPMIVFADFGNAALDFEARFFLADITNGSGVQNDIRFAIWERFKEEGIEIPSTPRFTPPPPEAKWPTDDDAAEAEMIHKAAEREKQRAKPRKGRAPRPIADPD